MAESTLTLTYADLKKAVAFHLGYSRTPGNWTTRQSDTIDEAVNRGLREFYYQATNPRTGAPHRWSFLNPRADFIVWPTKTTAAVTISGGSNTTFTAASGTNFYPSMEGKTIVADTSGNEYTIATYTSATVCTVETHSHGAADDGDTFTITADGDYTLPQDFQAIEGPLTYKQDQNSPWVSIEVSNEAEIRELRSQYSTGGIPVKSALDPLPYDSSSAQRWQVMLFPTPTVTYTLKVRYTRAPDAFTSDADYPPGGAQYTDVVRMLCEAAGEEQVNGQIGPKRGMADRMLTAAVMADTMNNAPEHMGQMMDYETLDERRERFVERRWSGQNITTNGF